MATEIWSDMQITDNQAISHLKVFIFADHKSNKALIIKYLHDTHPKVNPTAFNAPSISDHLFFLKYLYKNFAF